jgi:AcrR family transcriptional regulator
MRRLKQIEEYKQMISNALIRLMQEESMDQIRVSQITAEAGIGRNTFYNHFQKKEDILDYLLKGLVDELQEKLPKESNPSIRDFLLWRFRLLKENPLLTVFDKQDNLKHLLYRFRNSQLSLFDFTPQKDGYKNDFFQGGIDYVTSKWIVNGMKESPEEMADKIMSYMNR